MYLKDEFLLILVTGECK